MKSLPSTVRTCVQLIADSPDDVCLCLLVGVVENWIRDMAERFPRTSVVVPNAQLNFLYFLGLRQGIPLMNVWPRA